MGQKESNSVWTLADQLGNEFFSNHQVLLDAELPFQLGRAQQVWLGADANLSVGADHQFPRRNDYEAYVAYSVSLTRAFLIQAAAAWSCATITKMNGPM